MSNHSNPSQKRERQSEDSHRLSQEKQVFAAMHRQPMSMLMACRETGVMRENICRIVAKWRTSSKVFLLRKAPCLITGRTVGYYTTDTQLFTAIQLQLPWK